MAKVREKCMCDKIRRRSSVVARRVTMEKGRNVYLNTKKTLLIAGMCFTKDEALVLCKASKNIFIASFIEQQ